MTYVREEVRAIVEASDDLLSILGAGKASIFPQAVEQPPGKPPWIWLQMGDEPVTDRITRTSKFTWRVYDLPGQMYFNIDQIIGRLIRLFPSGSAIYHDPAGISWWQSLRYVSGDAVDDEWNQHVRWAEFQLWRDTP